MMGLSATTMAICRSSCFWRRSHPQPPSLAFSSSQWRLPDTHCISRSQPVHKKLLVWRYPHGTIISWPPIVWIHWYYDFIESYVFSRLRFRSLHQLLYGSFLFSWISSIYTFLDETWSPHNQNVHWRLVNIGSPHNQKEISRSVLHVWLSSTVISLSVHWLTVSAITILHRSTLLVATERFYIRVLNLISSYGIV